MSIVFRENFCIDGSLLNSQYYRDRVSFVLLGSLGNEGKRRDEVVTSTLTIAVEN